MQAKILRKQALSVSEMEVSMGDILNLARFKDERSAPSAGPAAPTGGKAELIFFPGVRVERQTVDLSVRHQHRAGMEVSGAKKAAKTRSRGFPADRK